MAGPSRRAAGMRDRPPVPTTKRDHIATELRRMIADGELPRGSRIQQDLLAGSFKTSITPVREALRLLEAEGVLVGEPHRGVRVADADYEHVKTTYLLRQAVEIYASRRALQRMSRRDLDLAEQLVVKMEVADADGDRGTLNATNHRFHFLIYGRCGNEGLVTEISVLWQKYPWDILQVVGDRGHGAAQEHRAILVAAKEGDEEALAEATRVHLANSFLALAFHMTGADVADPYDIDAD